MIVNGSETTREEDAAMRKAAHLLENVTVTITCGNLADHLAGSFPAISPRRCLSLAYEAMRIASQNPGVEVRLLGKA